MKKHVLTVLLVAALLVMAVAVQADDTVTKMNGVAAKMENVTMSESNNVLECPICGTPQTWTALSSNISSQTTLPLAPSSGNNTKLIQKISIIADSGVHCLLFFFCGNFKKYVV